MDWSKADEKVTEHFTVKECIWLPQWNRLATAADGLSEEYKNNLIKLMKAMEKIRTMLNRPIFVHVTYRSYDYNKLIGGAANSAHTKGMACDFHVGGMTCDEVRNKLLPKLEELGLRMEDLPGSNWVHVDNRYQGGKRFFKP
jgi:putative chitinase